MSRLIRTWQNLAFATQLTLTTTLLLVFVVDGLTLFFIRREAQNLQTELQQQAEIVLDALAANTGHALATSDLETLSRTIAEVDKSTRITSINFYNAEGQLLAAAPNNGGSASLVADPAGQWLVHHPGTTFEWQTDQLVAGRAVPSGLQPLGAIRVGLSTSALRAKQVTLRTQATIVALATSLGGLLLALLVNRVLAKPFQALIKATEQMTGGNFSQQIALRGNHELALLGQKTEHLRGTLQILSERLEQRVSQRTEELAKTNKHLQHQVAERQQAEKVLQQTNAKLARHLDELATLNHFIQTLTRVIDLRTVLKTVTRIMVQLFKAQQSSIALFNAAQTDLIVMAEYNLNRNSPSAVRMAIPVAGNPILSQIIEAKRPLVNSQMRSALLSAPDQRPVQEKSAYCVMLVPLLTRGEIIGAIEIDLDQNGRVFTADEIKLAETVAGQIAGALENARLFEEEQRQRQIAESLREVSTALNSSLDITTVLDKIFEQLAQVIQYDGTGLFLRENNNLKLQAGRNLPDTFIGARLALSSRNPTLVPFRNKHAYVVADVQQHPHWHSWPGGEQIRAWMGAPLLVQKEAMGVLTVDNFTANAYTEADARILQLFANQAAIAIQNARFYTAAQQEINQHKQTETALALARDQALEASRLKSELLAKVSHELRTPLGAIIGFAEMLQEGVYGQISNEQRQPTVEIVDSTRYLTNLVNELLDQTKLDAGQLRLNISTFALEDIVDQVQSQMTVLAQAKDLALTTHIAPDMPPILSGDPARLQQILVNLVGNAIKFTMSGQIEVKFYQKGPTHWVMQVSDTGPGIPIEDRDRIFEPFGQVDGSVTREHGGTGLGLSIAKQLIVLMGGEIRVESEIGQGSVFLVNLPLDPTPEAEERLAYES